MESKIANIKGLAELFNLEPTSDNARNLARESVVAEKAFESYFRQSGEKCEDVMNSIFGAENLRESQQMIVYEIDFFSGENFDLYGKQIVASNGFIHKEMVNYFQNHYGC